MTEDMRSRTRRKFRDVIENSYFMPFQKKSVDLNMFYNFKNISWSQRIDEQDQAKEGIYVDS